MRTADLWLRRSAVVLFALALAGGCGGDGEASTTTATNATTTAVPASSPPSPPPAAPEVGNPTAPAATPGAAAPTPGQPPVVQAEAVEPPADPEFPPGPFAVGTYTSHTTGTSTLNGTTEQVDRYDATTLEHVQGDDYRTSGGGFFVTVFRSTPTEVLLVTLDVDAPGFRRHFEPSPPALFFPIGAEPGRRWEWTITASDGPTTVAQSSTVAAPEVITVLGRDIEATVVDTVVTLSGDVTGTITTRTWVDPSTLQPLRVHAVSDVTVVTFRFQSDTTSTFAGFTASP